MQQQQQQPSVTMMEEEKQNEQQQQSSPLRRMASEQEGVSSESNYFANGHSKSSVSPSARPTSATPAKGKITARVGSSSKRRTVPTPSARAQSVSSQHEEGGQTAAPMTSFDFTSVTQPLSPPPSRRFGGVSSPGSSGGIFKQYFSPQSRSGHAAYGIYQTAKGGGGVEAVNNAALTTTNALDTLNSNNRARSTPGRAKTPSSAKRSSRQQLQALEQKQQQSSRGTSRSSGGLIGLGYSASAAVLPSSTSVASSPARSSSVASESGRGFTSSSFTRRMIHAQSAAELSQTGGNAMGQSLSTRSPSRSPPLSHSPSASEPLCASGDAEEESKFFLPSTSASGRSSNNKRGSSNPSSSPSLRGTPSQTQRRSIQSPALPSRGIVSTLSSAPASTRGSSSSSPTPKPLPAELHLPAHMELEHENLARALAKMEPAGRASLVSSPSVFNKLGREARHAILSRPASSINVSAAANASTSLSGEDFHMRPGAGSETFSDELLKRRSLQKSVENHRLGHNILATTLRHASGLSGVNLSPAELASAVDRTNHEYPISDERPKPVRADKNNAAPNLAFAAAAAAAGSESVGEIIGAATASMPQSAIHSQAYSESVSRRGSGQKLLMSPGSSRSEASRPRSASTSRLRIGNYSSRSDLSGHGGALILHPGVSSSATVPNASPSNPGASVLGFGGSIDRFAERVDDLRYYNTTTSSRGGRGIMASKGAQMLLAATIPTNESEANSTVSSTMTSAKRFQSLALELEVGLQERLARIEGRRKAMMQNSASSSPTHSDVKTTAAQDTMYVLERLDVFRTLFDEIILANPVFGPLLAKIKVEYETFARNGHNASSHHDALAEVEQRTIGQHRRSDSEGESAPPSSQRPATVTHQLVEDALVLENHRLHTKLHGFQRAYTSLYAKYKSNLQTVRIQESLLAQNALVLADLNEQLQASVRASMNEEEERMDMLRKEAFKLDNETMEERRVKEARRQRAAELATMPDDDSDFTDSCDDAENKVTLVGEDGAEIEDDEEARRRRRHLRRIRRLKKMKEMKAVPDPLERGRALMRAWKTPQPTEPTQGGDQQVEAGEGGKVVVDSVNNASASTSPPDREARPMSPTRLVSFLNEQVGETGSPVQRTDLESSAVSASMSAARSASASGFSSSMPTSRVSSRSHAHGISFAEDPLDILDQQTLAQRRVEALDRRNRELEEELRRMHAAVQEAKQNEKQMRKAMDKLTRSMQDSIPLNSSQRSAPSPDVSRRQSPGLTVADDCEAVPHAPAAVQLSNIPASSARATLLGTGRLG